LFTEVERGKPRFDRGQKAPHVKHKISLAQHMSGAEVEVTIGRVCVPITISPRASVAEAIFITPRPGLKLGAYVNLVVGQGGAEGGPNLRRVNLSAQVRERYRLSVLLPF
jgi:hypothetical protein